MAEEKSSLETAVSAAGSVKSAVKVGKAISAAAKGAAAGPYGAMLGFAWQHRKTMVKIVAAIAALLMLPVLFILMLPSLIFGDLSSSASNPALNDNTVIVDNMNEIAFSINSILSEGISDVLTRIDSNFATTGAYAMEVTNPYAADLIYNGNLLVAQYCAHKNGDLDSISLSDMESVLRAGRSNLYTFTSRQEVRQIVEDDPATTGDESEFEIFVVYTIIYNGEGYFADTVFHLTDEQKTLAADYAQNLSLFLGDGAIQSLVPSEFETGVSYDGVTFADGVTTVVYYNQLDERYKDEPYGTDHIGGYACGPTAMAMVVSSLTGSIVDPVEMSKWSYDNGYWCSKSGSYHSLIPKAAENRGLTVAGCTASEPQRIIDALASGKLVVALMTKGHFTSTGHFIVLRGVTSSGNILVADPASYNRSQQEWSLATILGEASKRAGTGGPFWIISL